jgi:hypothetical protein
MAGLRDGHAATKAAPRNRRPETPTRLGFTGLRLPPFLNPLETNLVGAGNSSRGRYGLAREQEKLSYVLT